MEVAAGEAAAGTGGAEAVVVGTWALTKEAKASTRPSFLTTQMTKVKNVLIFGVLYFVSCLSAYRED